MRILLVEDDEALAQRLRADLQRHGFAVDCVDNGVDAEHLGDEEPYDAVILDLGLPRRSGLDVLRNWRSRNNALPVIVLTARDAWQEKVEGFKAGADDYVAKPFHMDELLVRVQAVTRRSQGQTAGPLRVGAITLDEERQQAVLEDGRRVDLTGVEFRLLRYFMHHPGQILSKTRLSEHVYDYDSDKDSNVIEVYVKRLRRKLGSDLIQTRRGQGYVFGTRPR